MNKKTLKKIKLFRWCGVNDQGFRVQGEYWAVDVIEVKSILYNKKITPLQVKNKINFLYFLGKNKITDDDITEFTREASTLISSGMSLSVVFDIICEGSHKKKMYALVKSMERQVESGNLLSESLRSSGEYFDEVFYYLVYAGEQSGTLDVILNYIASHREKAARLKLKIRKALYYPFFVVVVGLFVSIMLLVLVIPQFSQLFDSVGAQLPLFTQWIIALSKFLQYYGWVALLMLGVSIFSLKVVIKRSLRAAFFLEKLLLKLPWIGRLLEQAIFARCFHNLSVMLHAGLSLLSALELTAKITGNQMYSQCFMKVAYQVQAGHSVHASFGQLKIFPYRIIKMLTVGEESGCLDKMLARLGEYFEQKVEDTVQTISQLLEPVIMVFLCLLVGSLVIAMYLPIFYLGAVI